jgi:hypothetical protein
MNFLGKVVFKRRGLFNSKVKLPSLVHHLSKEKLLEQNFNLVGMCLVLIKVSMTCTEIISNPLPLIRQSKVHLILKIHPTYQFKGGCVL